MRKSLNHLFKNTMTGKFSNIRLRTLILAGMFALSLPAVLTLLQGLR